MQLNDPLTALAVLAAFVGQYLVALKIRRDERLNLRKAILDDIAIFEKLARDDFYRENVRTNIQKAVLKLHPSARIYDRKTGYTGFFIYLIAPPVAFFLFVEGTTVGGLICIVLA